MQGLSGPPRRWMLGAALVLAAFAGVVAACAAFDAREAEPAEAGAGEDAFVDAGLEAGPRRFCDDFDGSPDASFCADFDGVEWRAGWDPGAEVIGGKLERDLEAFSPPAALRSTTNGDMTGPHAAPLARVFTGTQGTMAHARFRMRVPPSHPSGYAHYLAVRFGGKYVQFMIAQRGPQLVVKQMLLDGTASVDHPVDGNVDTGEWILVDFRVQIPGKIYLALDDAVVLNTNVTVVDAGQTSNIFYFGIWSDPADASWTASYDDVVLDVQ